MLSIEQCREILGDDSLTDNDVSDLRDTLYAWIDRFFDDYLEHPFEGTLSSVACQKKQ